MTENNRKWYTVVLMGETEDGPMATGCCVGAASVKEAQDTAKNLCKVAAFGALHMLIDFKVSAVFEGELTNVIEPEDGYMFKQVSDEEIESVMEVLSGGADES